MSIFKNFKLNQSNFPSVFSFVMSVMLIIKYESNTDLNIEALMDPTKSDAKVMEEAFSGKLYQESLKIWLPFLNKRGFLDTLLPNAPNTELVDQLLKQFQEMSQNVEGAGKTEE